eukprot:1143616-Pelagomonas_calceolata.AAC.5
MPGPAAILKVCKLENQDGTNGHQSCMAPILRSCNVRTACLPVASLAIREAKQGKRRVVGAAEGMCAAAAFHAGLQMGSCKAVDISLRVPLH